MNEKDKIAERLREEVLARFGSIKAFSESIGKTQQYVNIYLSGINAPGPKLRQILAKSGLDVPYVMTGRRGEAEGEDTKEFRRLKALMAEKGIRTTGELRHKLESAEAIARMLGPELYTTVLKAAAAKEKRVRYGKKKRRPGSAM